MKPHKFSIQRRLSSFKYAIDGLRILVREEHNARIQIVVAMLVFVLAIFLKIAIFEWIALLLSVGFVLVIEAINTSIENLADYVSPEKHDKIKRVKDLSAAAVLISAIIALIIGLIVFIPKIVDLVCKVSR